MKVSVKVLAVPPNQVFAELKVGADNLRLTVYQPWHPERWRVEAFIARRFQQMHGAIITQFLPCLISLEDQAGNILAAVGIRSAHTGPLFLEQYLVRPIEQELKTFTGVHCGRRDVIELGNLAGNVRGIGRCFIAVLSDALMIWGIHWLVCTGTLEVSNIFRRLNITPLPLAAARREQLRDGHAQWGSYYERQPVVMAGDLRLAAEDVRRQGYLSRYHYRRLETDNVFIA